MPKTILLAASALATIAAASAAHAQAANTTAPTEVAAVQVTARNLEATLPEQLAQTGVKVEVISGQQIRYGGYQDVATALQTLAPGVFALPENGPFSTSTDLSVLGSRTQDVLLLIDGVRINNRLFTTNVNLDTVPAGIVDRIEVLDGGQSLFYGTQAMGGAVNIVTRPFTDALSGALRLSYDSNTDRHYDANLSDGTKLGQFVIYASGDKSDGYQAFRDQDYQPSAGDHRRWFQMYTEGLKYQNDITSQLRVQGSYQRTDGKVDLPWPYRVYVDWETRAKNQATAKIDYQATDKLGLFVKGYWHNWAAQNTLDLTSPAGGTINVNDHAFKGYRDYGINALGKYDIRPGLQAYFGYDLQKYGGRDDAIKITQSEEEVNAGFGQLRLTPDMVPNLNLAAGFRYNAPSRGPSSTVWNVSGRYQLPMGAYVKGEFGTNFLLPSAEQLFAIDVLEQERGNPNLKPEESIGGEFTLGTRFDVMGHATTLEATGFARDISNVIDIPLSTFDPATGQYTFENLPGRTTTRGGQVEASTALTPDLKANLAYTYNETKNAGVRLNNIPLQLQKASVDWSPANLPVGITAALSYTGKATTPYSSTLLNYGEYATVDLSGRYFIDKARRQQLNLAVQNLFDRDYGRFYRGCGDRVRDFPLGCSRPYAYQNVAMPRTVSISYRYSF